MNRSQIGQDITCSACRYYLEQDLGMGACHRYPPSFAGAQTPRELHRWCFPMVLPRCWCGEYRAASAATLALPCDGQ